MTENKSPVQTAQVHRLTFAFVVQKCVKQVFSLFSLSLFRNLYLTFTNILTVISQSSEVTIPKSFEGKVRGWLGNKDDVFEEAHNQVCIVMEM